MFLSAIPIGLKIAGVAILASVVGLAYWHYNDVKSQRDAALQQVGALSVSFETQKNTIDQQTEAIDVWKQHTETLKNTIDKMDRAREDASQENKRIRGILERHDLEKLSLAKPGLIENRINRGTDRSLRMFESATNRSENSTGANR